MAMYVFVCVHFPILMCQSHGYACWRAYTEKERERERKRERKKERERERKKERKKDPYSMLAALRPLSVLCERRASVHYFAELHQRCLPGLL